MDINNIKEQAAKLRMAEIMYNNYQNLIFKVTDIISNKIVIQEDTNSLLVLELKEDGIYFYNDKNKDAGKILMSIDNIFVELYNNTQLSVELSKCF